MPVLELLPGRGWFKQAIAEPLMMPFLVIVNQVFVQGAAQVFCSEWEDA